MDYGDYKFYTGSFNTINRKDFTKSNANIKRDGTKDGDFKGSFRESVYKSTSDL